MSWQAAEAARIVEEVMAPENADGRLFETEVGCAQVLATLALAEAVKSLGGGADA